MKTRGLKLLIGALSITMVASLFAACGNKNTNKTEDNKSQVEEKDKGYTGSITSLGSSALQPLAEAAAKDFMAKHTDATVNVQGGGSGAGIKGVVEGSADIGNSDMSAEKKIKDKDLISQLVDHKVCGIGFSMVVSKDVTVDSLTKEQIQGIFTGKITNWKEVGGEDKEIVLIHRKSSSGTRVTFIDTVMDGTLEDATIGTIQPESGGVREAVKVTEGSISYLGLSYLSEDVREDVKPIKINGVEATNENIIKGDYPFWAYEHMYTKGEADGLKKSFLDFMVSEENNSNVEKLGYIPMSQLEK